MIKKLLWLTFYSLPVIAFAANLTEPHTEAVRQRLPRESSSAVKVIIHKRRGAQGGSATRELFDPGSAHRGTLRAQAVKAYVEAQAMKFGVNPSLAVWIVKHESQFNPRAKGDGEASRGLWQISKIYHPEVTDEVAFNVASSTDWSLERIRAGKAYEWSTYRFCRTLYKDCPF
jgi:hypothetical protein